MQHKYYRPDTIEELKNSTEYKRYCEAHSIEFFDEKKT